MPLTRFKRAVAFFLLCLACGAGQGASGPPNVLIILLDDSGYRDFGCFGGPIDTPRIDRLAAEGMRFTDCHSAAPNCSPSRAGLLTGRIPSRTGVYSYLPPNHAMHLPDAEHTIAETLKQAGYRTGHFGKWHLSDLQSDQPQPADQGFDHSFGTDNNAAPSHRNPNNFVRNGASVGEIPGFSCQIVVSEAVEWLRSDESRRSEAPFFACVWFHEPHSPIASPDALIGKYRARDPGLSRKLASYYANIENVDRAVGRLLDALDEMGASDDTFVFLTSDNGPVNDFSKGELRGKKSHVYEGGHRVPGIVRWPGWTPPNRVCSTPISGVDLYPTLCEIIGRTPPGDRALDGASILPLLLDRPFQRTVPLYWFFYRVNPSAALRVDDWVLLGYSSDADRKKTHPLAAADMPHIKSAALNRFELYRLSDDPGQRRDLYRERPEKAEALRRQLTALHADVVAEGPVWEMRPKP